MFALSALFAAAALALPASDSFAYWTAQNSKSTVTYEDHEITLIKTGAHDGNLNDSWQALVYDPTTNLIGVTSGSGVSGYGAINWLADSSGTGGLKAGSNISISNGTISVLTNGSISNGNSGLVTGGAVYNAVNSEATTRVNADTALSNRLGTLANDGGIIGSPAFDIFLRLLVVSL